MLEINNLFFAPQLFVPAGVYDIDFYKKGLGAIELRRWNNDDRTVHVAELSINDHLFHIHEEKPAAGEFNPKSVKGTTVLVGIFVSNVDEVVAKALKAGAILKSPAQTYDYGYRQAQIEDPFGHIWLIQQKV